LNCGTEGIQISSTLERLNVAAFIYLPKEIRGAAVGLLALLRNEGGSVGTSVAQIVQERRDQFHTLRLNEYLDTLNRPVGNLLAHGQAFFLQHTGDPPLSHQMALGVLGKSLAQQASSLLGQGNGLRSAEAATRQSRFRRRTEGASAEGCSRHVSHAVTRSEHDADEPRHGALWEWQRHKNDRQSDQQDVKDQESLKKPHRHRIFGIFDHGFLRDRLAQKKGRLQPTPPPLSLVRLSVKGVNYVGSVKRDERFGRSLPASSAQHELEI
jgi:hypothetical protein